ncbi:MAG: outer membrane beta-barrel protein [Pedobacter sp.]|nr:outer membrane beta-barrel protein [Pedobacter sp.]
MKFFQLYLRAVSIAKLITLFSLLLLLTSIAYAQTPQRTVVRVPPPLPIREISGIVRDSVDFGISGVAVRLSSEKDTLVAVTNGDGIFVFKNVKSASYTLAISSLGFKPIVAKFKQNDAVPRIVMDPIILKEAPANTLNEVIINGTPSITYKTDTVEYRASDYIVRENATVDELLKKMEGMEVGTDGSLIHQGTAVTKAKINGKTYLGGDVATAIQNLPAEIVDKIQMVDDYGDQAARTGIKDGDPEKILNIVTRADKSVGNTANIRAGAGNNERYEGSVFGTRLNKNQTIGVNAQINNTVNGVTSSGSNGVDAGGNGGGGGRGGQGGNAQQGRGNTSGSGGATGGTTNTGNSSFSFRDQLGKGVKINTNYRYTFNNRNSLNSSISQIFSSLGTTNAVNESSSDNNTKSHNFSFEVEADLDSNNFLRVSPTVTYQSTASSSLSSIMQTGLIHQDQKSNSLNTNVRPTLGATVFYQHIFAKPRRNFSFQLSLNNNNQDLEQEQNANIIYYKKNSDLVLKDSLIHRLVQRENLTKNYRASITFAEPLSANTQLEFNGQMNFNGYDNTATTSNINALNNRQMVDSLSNIYNYSFTQTRLAVNYRYGLSNTSKVKFSLGITAVPGLLKGTKVSLGTSTSRSSFNLIPIARFQYLWSRQHSVQISYSGNAQEPTFDQIQPVRDVSNPQNPIVGNPNLKVTFNHSINTNYNNYIANSKLNYSVNLTASFTDNAVVRNVVQIADSYSSLKNETRYVNINGVYRVNGNYSISKQLDDRKYNLSLSGNVIFSNGLSMSNNVVNTTKTWNMSERFGPRINPNEWLEVNPYISYTITKSDNTLPSSIDSKTNTLALSVDGKFYMWKTLIFGYSASKNYVSGINANVTNNPFVINSYIQKEMWKRRATVTFQSFDILNQNNFVNREISDNGITDTKTNALSRYFMLRVSMRLQKWSGAKGRNNLQPQRRGDGSFLN